MLISLIQVALVSLAVASTTVSLSLGKRAPSKPSFDSLKTLFIFGDSYSSTDFSPAGVLPSLQNQLGNPAYPGQTTCFGENWVDVLATRYSKTLVTWNLAATGAMIDKNKIPPLYPQYAAKVHDFKQQVEGDFASSCSGADARVSWSGSNSLFLVFIGHNDILTLSQKPHEDYAAQVQGVVKSYFGSFDKLYGFGARNFVVMLVSPMDKTPFVRAMGGSDKSATAAKSIVAELNSQLNSGAAQFEQAHSDAWITVFDSHKRMMDVLQGSNALGYKNVTSSCPDYAKLLHANVKKTPEPTDEATLAACHGQKLAEYMWLDGLHPTYPFHRYLADQIHSVIK